jgi:hypothetical protein
MADTDRPAGWLMRRAVAAGLWPDIDPGPPGETGLQRLERAWAWVSSESARERRQGLSVLHVIAPEEAIEPVFGALHDPDKLVRAMAFIILLGYDPPSTHADRIVSELGGELKAAQCFVASGRSAGRIGSFGLTDRLLPHLDEIARTGDRRSDRRRAAAIARDLRQHPPGWPLTDQPRADT